MAKGNRGWNLKKPHHVILYREANPGWKGDKASKAAKNMRARKWFHLSGMCEHCHVKPARDRHHKDGDPGNNQPDNIAFLCRRCHMEVDGRLARFKESAAKNAVASVTPPKPCINCGQPSKPLRKGRCVNCAAYFWRRGVERPLREQIDLQARTAQMYADYQTGLTLKQVGAKYGLSETGVFGCFKRAGLPRRKPSYRIKAREIMDFRELEFGN